MKNMKKVLIIILLIDIGILAFYLTPMRITPKVPLTSEDISIKVEMAGGNTGPAFMVDEDKAKLKKILKEKYPDKDIEPHYIELTGNLPYRAVNDPVLLSNYVVHGTIISADGGVTVIDVKYTDAKISRLFRDDRQSNVIFEMLIVFIAFISAFIIIIRFIILFIRELISNKR